MDIDASGELDFGEFVEFMDRTRRRPELEYMWSECFVRNKFIILISIMFNAPCFRNYAQSKSWIWTLKHYSTQGVK